MATDLHRMGVLTTIDRAALAAYCQAYGRWVEAEDRMREGQMLYKTPSGHVQQSPLLSIINKQLELMGRYMAELGMTPASRSRVTVVEAAGAREFEPITIEFVRPCDRLREPGADLQVSWKPTDSEGRPS